jgi:hypothetical protein
MLVAQKKSYQNLFKKGGLYSAIFLAVCFMVIPSYKRVNAATFFAPTNVATTWNSDTQITITWTDTNTTEDNYRIERMDDTGSGYGSYTQIGSVGANVTTFVDNSTNHPASPPAANRRYTYRVRAYKGIPGPTYSSYSTAVEQYTTPVTPVISLPSADNPYNPGDPHAITWNWTNPPAVALVSPVYTIGARQPDCEAFWQDAPTSTSGTDFCLYPNTQYVAYVIATGGDRQSGNSATTSPIYTFAAVPSDPGLVVNSPVQITASWNANENPAGTQYYVENTTASTTSGWITDLSWTSTGLTPNTSYTFKVKARNADNIDTAFTDDVSATTYPVAAPTNALATYNSDNQIILTWTDNSTNETGFVVERSDDFGEWAQIATTSAEIISYVDTGTSANHAYQYRLRAFNTNGYSPYSTDNNYFYTSPAAPTMHVPVVDSTTAITWTWTNNASYVGSYSFWLTTGGTTHIEGIDPTIDIICDEGICPDPSDPYYQLIDLTPNTRYAAQVGAFITGRAMASSSVSNPVYTWANVPASLTAAADSDIQITASWLANDNPAGTQYLVVNTTASTSSGWITDTSWASTGLTASTTYTFKVKARNGDNVDTNYTSDVTATTHLPAPSGAAAAYNSNTQIITLAWIDNSSDEVMFAIERSTDNGSFTSLATTSANVVSYTDISVSANHRYQYRVRAYNANGYSSYSTDASTIYITQNHLGIAFKFYTVSPLPNQIPQTLPDIESPVEPILQPDNFDSILIAFNLSRDEAKEALSTANLLKDTKEFKLTLTNNQKTVLSNFITYNIPKSTIDLSSDERRAVLRDYFDTVKKSNVDWQDIGKVTSGQKPLNRNLDNEKLQVGKVLGLFKKIVGHLPDFKNNNEDLAWNTLMYRIRFERDLNKEAAAIVKFKKVLKYQPTTPLDWSAVRMMAYTGV